MYDLQTLLPSIRCSTSVSNLSRPPFSR